MKKVIKNAIGFTLIEFMIVVLILGIVLATIVPIYKEYKQTRCSNFEPKKCYTTNDSNPFVGENKICIIDKKKNYIKVKKYTNGTETICSGTCKEFSEYTVEK